MVSHIQLAQKEGQSVKEIHERALALNKVYFLDVFKNAQDGLWYGGVWKKGNCGPCRKEACQGCVECLIVLSEGFIKPQYAACFLNRTMDAATLSPATEKKIGLTNADLALLQKLNVRPTHRENAVAFQMKKAFDRALY